MLPHPEQTPKAMKTPLIALILGLLSFTTQASEPAQVMLFGTFHNPHAFDGRCGFGPDVEPRLGAMLAGQNLSGVRGREVAS